MHPDSITKRCPRCDQDLPRDAFRRDTNRRDGLYVYCKACEKTYQQSKAQSRVVTERYCPACGQTLPASSFAKNKQTMDGLHRYCRVCDAKRCAQFRAEHERNRSWEERHPDRVREIKRRSAKRHPATQRENRMRYYARKRTATIEKVDYEAIWQRDQGICHICGLFVLPDNVHYDHIVPLANGGIHAASNIAISHPWCNLRKGTKPITEVTNRKPTR